MANHESNKIKFVLSTYGTDSIFTVKQKDFELIDRISPDIFLIAHSTLSTANFFKFIETFDHRAPSPKEPNSGKQQFSYTKTENMTNLLMTDRLRVVVKFQEKPLYKNPPRVINVSHMHNYDEGVLLCALYRYTNGYRYKFDGLDGDKLASVVQKLYTIIHTHRRTFCEF